MNSNTHHEGIEHILTGVGMAQFHKIKKLHKFWNFFVSVNCVNLLLVSHARQFWNTLVEDLNNLIDKIDELDLPIEIKV